MGVEVQAAEEAQGLSEAQQAAEDEEALRVMREEGMLAAQPGAEPSAPGNKTLTYTC